MAPFQPVRRYVVRSVTNYLKFFDSASQSLAIDQILVASCFDHVPAYPAWLGLKLPLTVRKITL